MKRVIIEYDLYNCSSKGYRRKFETHEASFFVSDLLITDNKYLKRIAVESFIKPMLENLVALYGADDFKITGIELV